MLQGMWQRDQYSARLHADLAAVLCTSLPVALINSTHFSGSWFTIIGSTEPRDRNKCSTSAGKPPSSTLVLENPCLYVYAKHQCYHSCTLTLLSTLIRSLKYYSLCYCFYRCSARARSTAGRAMSLWAMLRSSEEKGLSSSRDSAREKEVELQLTKQESTMEG